MPNLIKTTLVIVLFGVFPKIRKMSLKSFFSSFQQIGPRCHIHNTSFSSLLTNWTNKLQHLTLASLSSHYSLLGRFVSTKKIQCCSFALHPGQNLLNVTNTLAYCADVHSFRTACSCPTFSLKSALFDTGQPEDQPYKTFYGRNLWICVISQSVYPWQAFPAQSNVCT